MLREVSNGSPNDAPTDPVLTIGYSTLASRAHAIELPSPRPDVEILVVIQRASADFRLGPAERDDVRTILDDGVGVARSRNIVLEQAAGRYVLFGDDDATFIETGVDSLLEMMERSPDVSFLQGRALDETGRPRKRYPKRATRLRRWNSAKIGTIELMVRRADVVASCVRFDERFGAGAANHLGDEYIFVADALRAGLAGRFVPVSIAVHPAASSGSTGEGRRDARVRSAVFDRVFGWWAPLPRLAFLVRRPRRFGSVGLGIRFVVGGRAIE